MLQLIIPFVLTLDSFSFSLGGSHSKSRARPVPVLTDRTAKVDRGGCGEVPGGRGRERDEREVVEVRQVSDVSGLEDAEERMKCGWIFLQREACSLFRAAGFSKDPDQPWLEVTKKWRS